MAETKKVPAQMCRMTAEAQFGDNGPDSKTVPIQMLARSGKPLSHWFWGDIVHDMSGMRMHKARLPIDYVHNSDEVIGYLNHFSTEAGDLSCSGALTPFKDGDRAAEVIYKGRNGVPWEASIDWSGEAVIEELSEGESAVVNGAEVVGPMSIVREWQLRGVAVCPYGADMNTESRVFSDGDRNVAITVRRHEMAQNESAKPVEGVEAEVVEEPVETVEPVEAEEKPEVTEEKPGEAAPVEPVAVTEDPKAAVLAESKRFIEAFGDRGATWFLEGKSYEEAQALRITELEAEVKQLSEQAKPPVRGEDAPLSTDTGETDKAALRGLFKRR